MGAWGPHPQDNDTAADFCVKLEDMTLRNWVLAGLKSEDYDENRIAAWMLRQVGFNYVWPAGLDYVCKMAIERLQVILDDDKWRATWIKDSDRGMVVADIRSTQSELARRIGNQTCQRCGSVLDKDELCTDETCPFCETDQDDERGWIGHPSPRLSGLSAP